jgi:DHA1 family multidrug resistance protein-like MFS transporter
MFWGQADTPRDRIVQARPQSLCFFGFSLFGSKGYRLIGASLLKRVESVNCATPYQEMRLGNDGSFGEESSQLGSWKRSLTIAWVAQFLCCMGLTVCIPFIPFYIRELGITDGDQVNMWAGTIMAGCSITVAVVSPFWGFLADRKGPKLMAMRAAFGGAITLIAIAFATTVQQLAVIRVIQCALTGMTLAFVMLVSSCVPLSRVGFSLGLMQMGAYLAFSVGPVMSGIVADNFGYRRTFGAIGVLPLIAGVLVFALVDGKFVMPRERKAINGIKHGARAIVHSKSVVGAVLVSSALFMARAVSQPILPLFVESLSPNPSLVNMTTGTVYGAFSAASAISAMLIGRLSDHVGFRNVLLICGAGGSLTYIGQALSPNLTFFIMSTFATGVFVGGMLPTANAILAHTAPKGQLGTVYGLSNSVNSGGRALGPMLGATISTTWGMRSTFVAAAVLLTLVTVWIALGVEPREEVFEERSG